MSGFFKKLFNRITGKKDEPPPPVPEALPAPEPEAPPAETVAIAPPEPAAPAPAPVVEPQPVPPADVVPESAPEPAPAVETSHPPVPAAAATAKPVAKARPEPEPRPAPKSKARLAPRAPEPKAKPVPKTPEPKSKPAPKAPEPKAPEPKTKPAPKAPEPKPVLAKVAPKAEPKASPAKPKPAPKSVAKSVPVEIVQPEPEAPPPAPATIPVEVLPPAPPPPPPPITETAPPAPAPAPAPVAEAAAPLPDAAEAAQQRKGWFSRLKDGLSKSSKSITGSITSIFTKRKLDRDTLQDLEDVLLQADLGLPMAERIVRAVSEGRYDKEIDPEEVKRILATEVAKVLKPVEVPFNFGAEKPFIILVVGVNGAGKTTTIGKLGAIATREGFKVMFAACDTFRAAAIEQLTVWGQRIGARTMSRPTGADASGLAFDAIKEAKADGTDIVFIDTAGRLQNKAYLMDELDKIVRVIRKQDDTAPHAVLLVLDATTGQNAMAQAEIFTKVAGVTGIIMTKLDGTARGGILVAIAEKFKLPVHAIGVGETIDDLQPFEAEGFARAIAGLEDQ
jgi:fused signal recognition particle receptor